MVSDTSDRPPQQSPQRSLHDDRRSQGVQAMGDYHEEPQKPHKNKAGKRRARKQGLVAKDLGYQEAASAQRTATSKKHTFCMYHLQGTCRHTGATCPYAHSVEEMKACKHVAEPGSTECRTEILTSGDCRPLRGKSTPLNSASNAFSSLGFCAPPSLAPCWSSASTGAADPWFDTYSLQSLVQSAPMKIDRSNVRAASPLLVKPKLSPPPVVSPPPGLELEDAEDAAGAPLYIDVSSLSARQPCAGTCASNSFAVNPFATRPVSGTVELQ